MDTGEFEADWPVTKYCGCGKCLIGSVRLSRKTESTQSPETQRDKILGTAADNGGHIIAWTRDLEVSGATDPFTRPELGPWLQDKLGPYDGIVSAAVDRIGRDVYEGLNLARYLAKTRRLVFTTGHAGPWNLEDPADETQFLFALFGAQIEHRAITTRIREDTVNARKQGRKKSRHSYGFRYIRLTPKGAIDHQELDPHPASIARAIAARILMDEDYTITPATEAVRLNRSGELSPKDYEAVQYGRKPQGSRWTAEAIRGILTSWASVGYLTHNGSPVIGKDGHYVKLCEGLWDEPTRLALIEKTKPRSTFANARAPKGERRLSGRARCGICGERVRLSGRPLQWRCTARVNGIRTSLHCKPSPGMLVTKLDALVEEWFLATFGASRLMERVFDPGTGHAGRIAQLESERERLRSDRQAGLYDSPDDAAWFREVYARIGKELAEVKSYPERPAELKWVPTGETVADQWARSSEVERREMLANYHVKVVLYPRGHSPRVWIHNLSDEAEADAIEAMAKQRQAAEDDQAAADLWNEAHNASTLALARMLLNESTLTQLADQDPTNPATMARVEAELRALGIEPDGQVFGLAA
jgi:DNA invertase Pin-like site-specific DNA recombinase